MTAKTKAAAPDPGRLPPPPAGGGAHNPKAALSVRARLRPPGAAARQSATQILRARARAAARGTATTYSYGVRIKLAEAEYEALIECCENWEQRPGMAGRRIFLEGLRRYKDVKAPRGVGDFIKRRDPELAAAYEGERPSWRMPMAEDSDDSVPADFGAARDASVAAARAGGFGGLLPASPANSGRRGYAAGANRESFSFIEPQEQEQEQEQTQTTQGSAQENAVS